MKTKTIDPNELAWLKKIEKLLLGRTIKLVRYMTNEEANEFGWYRRAVVIQLNDGTCIYPSRDDEGNDAGALFTTSEELPTIPVFYMGEE